MGEKEANEIGHSLAKHVKKRKVVFIDGKLKDCNPHMKKRVFFFLDTQQIPQYFHNIVNPHNSN